MDKKLRQTGDEYSNKALEIIDKILRLYQHCHLRKAMIILISLEEAKKIRTFFLPKFAKSNGNEVN